MRKFLFIYCILMYYAERVYHVSTEKIHKPTHIEQPMCNRELNLEPTDLVFVESLTINYLSADEITISSSVVSHCRLRGYF